MTKQQVKQIDLCIQTMWLGAALLAIAFATIYTLSGTQSAVYLSIVGAQ